MMILYLTDLLLRGGPPKVELPSNFLRQAFETTNAVVYHPDPKNENTATATVVQNTIKSFGLNARLADTDVRVYRANQSGAAAIFTETATPWGSKGESTALFILTQAEQPPTRRPFIESVNYKPVFVFEGQHTRENDEPKFICNSINYQTEEIDEYAVFSDAKKGNVRIGHDWVEVVNGLAFGEQCFQQFLRGEKLSPAKAQAALEQISQEELNRRYGDMTSRSRSDQIVQLAERLPL